MSNPVPTAAEPAETQAVITPEKVAADYIPRDRIKAYSANLVSRLMVVEHELNTLRARVAAKERELFEINGSIVAAETLFKSR